MEGANYMAIPTPSTPFTLSTLEQALVAGVGTADAAALAGTFGPLDLPIKAIAVFSLAVVSVLGYKHLVS